MAAGKLLKSSCLAGIMRTINKANSLFMRIESTAFAHNGDIPSKYTCDGDNISPPLAFVDIPVGTKSFVLIMHDPDVPKNIHPEGDWDHWVVFNIPPTTKDVGEGEPLPGLYGLNSRGKAQYHGPCPPDREHRYFFKLYALDTLLKLSADVYRKEVEEAMHGHIIEEAELVGKYERL